MHYAVSSTAVVGRRWSDSMPIQQFVSQLLIEGLDVAVFPWTARFDEQRADAAEEGQPS